MKSIPHILHHFGCGYHADGTIKQGRKIVARYYKCDAIGEEARKAIMAANSQAWFGTSRMQYAPEVSSRVVFVPTIAELKRRKNKLAA